MSCLRGLWGVFDEDPGFAMDTDDLPFTWLTVAGTVPNILTPSDFIGGMAAGDDDIDAETSSIDPKDTAGPGIATVSRAREEAECDSPCFVAPTLFRGMLTPSLICIPWPRVLGRLE